MIRFERVAKSYPTPRGRKHVLRETDFHFPPDRSVGLLGRNGAGKSTLLRMIGGSVEPDSGRIRRFAHISWPLGFGGAFPGSLTGAQNARFIARIYGVDTDDMVARVAAFSELGDYLDMPVASYSSGMRARLAFAASMAVDFDVYLVDEITAVGDAAFKRKCAAAFDARAETSRLIMVSHATGTIRRYCQSAIVLEDGRMRYFEDVEEGIAAHEENMRRARTAAF